MSAFQPFHYVFDWDPRKESQNEAKHGVSFRRSTAVFRDPHAMSVYDSDHSSAEDRWITIRRDYSGTLLVVCHTYRARSAETAEVRIISARKATNREYLVYEEG